MESTASFAILGLLLGFSQALTLNQTQHVDITTRILTTNNGSSERLLEGDILLPTSRNAMKCRDNSCLWKKASNGLVEVPYTLGSTFSFYHRSVIEDAMAVFHKKTCIRFVARTNQADYLRIKSGDGCYSYVGRTGGAQTVSLSRLGCVYKGIVQHELIHALGFYHEHTRSDRDNYVTINWENINPATWSNFGKQDTNNLNTLYDYASVMHYGRAAFSINGLDTITPFPNPSVNIGQREDLSDIDIHKIKNLYNC